MPAAENKELHVLDQRVIDGLRSDWCERHRLRRNGSHCHSHGHRNARGEGDSQLFHCTILIG